MAVGNARMWFDEATDTYAISTPFNRHFVDWLKFAIDKNHRSFDPVRKIWFVSRQSVGEVRKKAETLWSDFEFTDKIEVRPMASQSELQEFVQLIGVDALTKAYKEAVLRNHPDRGGDSNKMARINQLWTKIKQTLV